MEYPSLFVKLLVETKSTEANNLNIYKIINYMGSYISQEDFVDIEQSLSQRKNIVKNIFFYRYFCYCTSTLILRFNECWSVNT